MEGRGHRVTEPMERTTAGTAGPDTVSTKLQRIAELVKLSQGRPFTALAHFIDVDWLDAAEQAGAPLVVLFHGLEGSSASHYAGALMHALAERGWAGAPQDA